MKLLTTAIFLIVSLVMMNSSFAQSDDILAAIERQTAAIEKQTEAIKEQTIIMRVIAAIEKRDRSGELSVGLSYRDIKEAIDYIKTDYVE